MDLLNWAGGHWFDFVQTLGIVGGLVYTGRVVRIDAKVRRIQNLFWLTKQHREIWSLVHRHPALARVIDPNSDPNAQQVTPEEELFVTFVILHLSNMYQATLAGFFVTPEGLANDIREFFSLPVPRVVWSKVSRLQDRSFTRFVESVL